MTGKQTPQIAATLRTAAKRLRLGVDGPLTADALEAIAAAFEAPQGYCIRVHGLISHDYFLPTADGARRAARDNGFADHEFEVVPVVALGAVNTDTRFG